MELRFSLIFVFHITVAMSADSYDSQEKEILTSQIMFTSFLFNLPFTCHLLSLESTLILLNRYVLHKNRNKKRKLLLKKLRDLQMKGTNKHMELNWSISTITDFFTMWHHFYIHLLTSD